MRHYVCSFCDNGFAVEALYTNDHVGFCPFCGEPDPRIANVNGPQAARGAAVRRGDMPYRSVDSPSPSL